MELLNLVSKLLTYEEWFRSFGFFQSLLLWQALGFKLAWHKSQRGQSVDWIGARIEVQGAVGRDLKISLPPDKTAKILSAF